jgi:hypothetical protein
MPSDVGQGWKNPHMRGCDVEGCDRIHRAKGLCSTHYNQQMPAAKRHPKVTMRCAWCDAEVEKDAGRPRRYAFIVCGDACRNAIAKATASGPWASGNLRSKRTPTRTELPSDHPARWYGATSSISYSTCAECGATIIQPPGNRKPRRFCPNDQCKRRRVQRAHRARKRGAVSDGYTRIEIFERDNWVCWICGDSVNRDADPLDLDAPTIDHKTALAVGGSDTRENVATAHRWCNSVKRELPIDHVA